MRERSTGMPCSIGVVANRHNGLNGEQGVVVVGRAHRLNRLARGLVGAAADRQVRDEPGLREGAAVLVHRHVAGEIEGRLVVDRFDADGRGGRAPAQPGV